MSRRERARGGGPRGGGRGMRGAGVGAAGGSRGRGGQPAASDGEGRGVEPVASDGEGLAGRGNTGQERPNLGSCSGQQVQGRNGDAGSGSGAPPLQHSVQPNVAGGGGRGRATEAAVGDGDGCCGHLSDADGGGDGGRSSTVNGEAGHGGGQGGRRQRRRRKKNRRGGGHAEPGGRRDAVADAGGGNEGRGDEVQAAPGSGDPGGRRGARTGGVEQKRPHLGGPSVQPLQRDGRHDADSRRGTGCNRGREDEMADKDDSNASDGGGGDQQQHHGGGSGVPRRNFLSDAVLSWSIADVLNENLFAQKVQPKPSKFDSVEHFVDIQSTVLLEETRSTISSAIKSLAEVQYCQLISTTPCDASVFYLDIDLVATRSEPIYCSHTAKDFDICLLSMKAPKAPDFDVTSCCLGIATGIGRETFFQRSFKVLASANEILQPEKFKFVSFLTNISYKMELSKVLSLCNERDKMAVRNVQELFKKVGKTCNFCCQSPHNNDDNARVIASLSSSLTCPHQYYTGVVWSPPGTQNDCVSNLVKECCHRGMKVLISLPRGAYLPDFLMGIEDNFDSSDQLTGPLVLSSVSELGMPSKFEKALLENKSQQLYCCFMQCKGSLKWMHNLLNLTAFNHSPRCSDSAKCKQCKLERPFSVKLFSERFSGLLMKVSDSLNYMINNASAICLFAEDGDNILELLHLMEQVEDSLHNMDLTDESVMAAFGLNLDDSIVVMESSSVSLNEHRTGCIKLIDALIESLQCPQLKNRDELDRFCIQHSSIIVTPLDLMGKLNKENMDTFDILIVTGSGQMTESDLLIPLGLPLGHIVFFGDHIHLQPFVQSKLCKEAGFNRSIYEGLRRSTSENLMLTQQYVRHPVLNEFITNLFYNKKIKDAPKLISMNEDFKSLGLPILSFMDVPTMESKPIHSAKSHINFAAIVMLLRHLSTDLTNANEKLSIGLVYLSNNEANSVGERLRNVKEISDRFHLQVKFIGNLKGQLFDIIILPTIVEDIAELNCVDANSLNVAVSSSRKCCILIGEHETLLQSGGIWKEVSKYARRKKLTKIVDVNALIEVMNKLEKDTVDNLSDPAHSRKMPGQEFTLDGRPRQTKHTLANVRDQRGQPDTCTRHATLGAMESLMKLHNASMVPPQDSEWKLSEDDLKKKHEESSGKEFRSEDIADRGIQRLESAFDTIKLHGVEGKNKNMTKEFKISAYAEVDIKNTEAMKKLFKEGNVLIGTFKLSMNYFNLKPGEVYIYDKMKPFKHPKSGLTASHAVMMIGLGLTKTLRPNKYFRHLGMQNSEGRLFGINGLGRVAKNSLKDLYRIELEKPAGLEPF